MKAQFRRYVQLVITGASLLAGLSLLTACVKLGTPSPSTTTTSPTPSTPVAPAPPPIKVAVTPSTASPLEGGSVSFVATVTGATNTGVVWSVQEGSAGGSITISGVYTAPIAAGTFHVVATSVADGTVRAVASVYVPVISVSVSPDTAQLKQGESLPLVATVQGIANTAVTWEATQGSITSLGVYTAPVGPWGTVMVTARSSADSTRTGYAYFSIAPTRSNGFFTATGSMTTPRIEQTATLLKNGKVLIAGGWDGFQPLASAELYDPQTGTFSATGNMTTPRHAAVATLLADGRVLIAGGDADNSNETYGKPVFSAEIYDPATGAFTATGNLEPAGGQLSMVLVGDLSVLLPDGRVFVAARDKAEIYDPRTGSFTVTGPYLSPSGPFPEAVTVLPNGKVLYCDGSVEVFDPQSGTFSAVGQVSSDNEYAATLLADGRVLFYGYDNDFHWPGDTEIYDYTTGTFTILPNPQYHYAPLSRLSDGTILIAGGGYDTGALVFVPSNGTFEIPGPMTALRASHTSTALPDGTALIAGGWGEGVWPTIPVTATAEIYHPQ